MTLIEIKKDEHYIVVDDSEIKEGDWFYNPATKEALRASKDMLSWNNDTTQEHKGWKRITHSTPPLEYNYYSQKQGFNMGVMSSDIELIFDKIKPLPMSEVEEAIYGYSVEKVYPILSFEEYLVNPPHKESYASYVAHQKSKRDGFNAHKELVKDKLFTVEDLRAAFTAGDTGRGGYTYNRVRKFDGFDEYITKKLGYFWDSEKGYVLLPKTEWEVEITTEGKIVLL